MRRTTALLIAVFAPSVAHAASCSPANSAALTTCLASVVDGDVVSLTAGLTYSATNGFVVPASITIQQVAPVGAKPIIKSTGTGGSARASITVNAGKTLTIRDTKLDNDSSASDNKPIIDILAGGSVVGESLQFEAAAATTLAAGIEVRDGSRLALTNSVFNGVLTSTSGYGSAIQALTNTTIALNGVTADKGNGTAMTGRGGFLAVGSGSTVSITTSTIKNFTAYRGGAVYANAPTAVTITGSTFDTNKAADSNSSSDDGGCLAIEAGSMTVSGSTFKDCDSGDDGGGIYVYDGNLTISDSFVTSDHASGDGGAIYVERGNFTATKLTSSANDASENGGSILLRGATSVRTASVSTSTFATDKADWGGAIYADGANLTVASSTFTQTKATYFVDSSNDGDGGGIYARASDVTVTDSKFDRTEAAGDGGAIYATDASVNSVTYSSDVLSQRTTFTGSKATDDAGSMYVSNGTVAVEDSIFVDSKSGDLGGAIILRNVPGFATIDRTSFTTSTAGGHGGALYVDNSDAVLTDDMFTTNKSARSGGAAYLTGGSTLDSTNGDFVSNTATDDGGAIYGYYNTSITIDGGTMDANAADNGGAIRAHAATVAVDGTSFTGNAAGTGDGGAISIYVFSDGNGNYSDQDHAFILKNASYTSNTAASDGAAIAMTGWGSLTVDRSDFTANKATVNGGALWLMPDDDGNDAGAYAVTNSIFSENDAGAGGAVYADASQTSRDSFTFTDNSFTANTAGAGGGIWVDQTYYANIGRNVFCDNWADTTTGGGVYVGANISTSGIARGIYNNFIVENRSKQKGGGVFLGTPNMPVLNNLFLTNTSDTVLNGGGIWLETDGATIRNNLILGTIKGDGVRLPLIAATKEEYNGYAANLDNNRIVVAVPAAPSAPSFVFATAPSFFSYAAGTPGDKAGCDAADFRMWMWPDASQPTYPSPITKNAGSTASPVYTDLDASTNDIGPFGGAGASPAWWTDADGDGAPWVYDCNDADKTIFPGATEVCNGVDDDCDKLLDDNATVGTWYKDGDGDGFGLSTSTLSQCTQPVGYVNKGGDCDDVAAAINPGAVEKCSTVGVDDDCNGQADEPVAVDAVTWYADTDIDGYGNLLAGAKACVQPANTTALARATDCDDAVFATNPGASETCNTIDDDCDKQIDEGALDAKSWYPDADKDSQGDATAAATKACTVPSGFAASNTDCNDKIGTTYLGAPELCNKVDDDCDSLVDDGLATSSWYVDGDLDSYGTGAATIDCAAPAAGWTKQSGDCNDASATINPSAADNTCNGVDDNCDTKVDDGAAFQSWYEDKDADKYGTSVTKNACAQPAGYAGATGDCNDALSTVHPGALETCNLVDDDCDGSVDNNVVTYTFYEDKDGDGFGGAATKTDCKAPAGYVIAGGDCNDASKAISPGAAELCNDNVDQNCDGDENKDAIDAKAWYADTDKDGQGDPSAIVMSCDPVADRVATGKDCDDKDSTILDGLNWYGDSDGDSYGNVNDRAFQCTAPSGYLADATDCNDANKAIHPNTAERCSTTGIDDDCDKLVDDQDPQGVADGTTFYVDADNDTYGNKDALTTTNGTRSACLRPPGYAVNALDCDDTTSLNRPGAAEQCDGIDNNCNVTIDENVSFTPYWADDDGDGFGDATAATVIDCVAPAGYTDNDTDCDDTRVGVNPNAPEQCATLGIDDDCDGQFDESDAIDQTAYYLDEDGDDWAIIADEILACEQPPNHSTQLGDCDDLDVAVNPQATEICDGIDNDCDGRADEGLGAQTVYVDLDGDGFGDDATAAVVCRPPGVDESDVGGDCDDDDETINPAATEVWYDGVDQDCLGNDDDDQDGDGVPLGDGPADDCDDVDASSYPGALDVPGDGIDQDCDGADDQEAPSERPFDTDLLDTGILGVPGEACGCATPTGPAWSLTALVAAFIGWRRARRDGTQR